LCPEEWLEWDKRICVWLEEWLLCDIVLTGLVDAPDERFLWLIVLPSMLVFRVDVLSLS
jgi:hypothetical protein